MDDALLVILALVAVLLGAYYVTKLIARRATSLARGRHMKVLDNMIIGRDKSIMMVKVQDKVLLIGVTNQSIQLLEAYSSDQIHTEQEQVTGKQAKSSDTPVYKRIGQAGAWLKNIINAPKQLQNAQQAQRLKKKEIVERETVAPQTESDEIDLMIQSIHQRKRRLADDHKKDGSVYER